MCVGPDKKTSESKPQSESEPLASGTKKTRSLELMMAKLWQETKEKEQNEMRKACWEVPRRGKD